MPTSYFSAQSAPMIEDYAQTQYWSSGRAQILWRPRKIGLKIFNSSEPCFFKIFDVCLVLVLRSSERVVKHVEISGNFFPSVVAEMQHFNFLLWANYLKLHQFYLIRRMIWHKLQTQTSWPVWSSTRCMQLCLNSGKKMFVKWNRKDQIFHISSKWYSILVSHPTLRNSFGLKNLCDFLNSKWIWSCILFQLDVKAFRENVDLKNYVSNGEWELLEVTVIIIYMVVSVCVPVSRCYRYFCFYLVIFVRVVIIVVITIRWSRNWFGLR